MYQPLWLSQLKWIAYNDRRKSRHRCRHTEIFTSTKFQAKGVWIMMVWKNYLEFACSKNSNGNVFFMACFKSRKKNTKERKGCKKRNISCNIPWVQIELNRIEWNFIGWCVASFNSVQVSCFPVCHSFTLLRFFSYHLHIFRISGCMFFFGSIQLKVYDWIYCIANETDPSGAAYSIFNWFSKHKQDAKSLPPSPHTNHW